MGLYVWICEDEKCKEETLAIAEPEDRDNKPEESCKCGAKLVKRKMCAATIHKSGNWGPGKGYW